MTREEAIEVYNGLINTKIKEAFEFFAPELRESEDERIRKALVIMIKVPRKEIFEAQGITKEQALAYLEKPKEPSMSAEEVLARAGLKPYKDGNKWCILAGDNIQDGICGFGDTIDEALYQFLMEVLEVQKEQKPNFDTHWENGSMVCKQKEQKSAEIDEDIELGLNRALQIIKEAKGVLKGYQSDDGIYECDHAIRTLTHILKNGIEQKPAEWSEEDEKIRRNLMSLLVNMRGDRITEETYQKYYPWLKNLHPSWKPSVEQMEALSDAYVEASTFKKGDILESLYDDLEKLT